MRIIITAFLFISCFCKVWSQNIVGNASFEEYIECPDNVNEINFCKDWWKTDVTNSPEYFHACSEYNLDRDRVGVPENLEGYRYAQDGKAYVGIVLFDKTEFNYREYIQTSLKLPMNAGHTYHISAYVSLADSSRIPGNYLSFCFSSQKKLMPDIMKAPLCSCENRATIKGEEYFNHRDWVQITVEYIARGDEKYLTIGCFKEDYSKAEYLLKVKKYKKLGSGYRNNNNHSYLLIDNISVMDKEEIMFPKFK